MIKVFQCVINIHGTFILLSKQVSGRHLVAIVDSILSFPSLPISNWLPNAIRCICSCLESGLPCFSTIPILQTQLAFLSCCPVPWSALLKMAVNFPKSKLPKWAVHVCTTASAFLKGVSFSFFVLSLCPTFSLISLLQNLSVRFPRPLCLCTCCVFYLGNSALSFKTKL